MIHRYRVMKINMKTLKKEKVVIFRTEEEAEEFCQTKNQKDVKYKYIYEEVIYL